MDNSDDERTAARAPGRPARAATRPAIIGHRGASGYRPEHTASAYRLAFALGADAVEPDIVATRDGVLVIRHDAEISTTTDVASRPEFAHLRTTKEIDGVPLTGWFTEDFTWEQLATLRAVERLGALRPLSASFDGAFPILRMRDLFALTDDEATRSGRPLGIVAEIKHATYFESIGLPLDELFAAEVSAAGWADASTLVVESFEKTVLGKLARRGVRADWIYLIESHGAPADRVARDGAAARSYDDDVSDAGLLALAAEEAGVGVDGVSVDLSRILTAGPDGEPSASELPVRAGALGLQTYCWTLRPENAFLSARFRRGASEADLGDWRGEFELVLGSGVDAVFADHPDLAVAVRDGMTQPAPTRAEAALL
ncbi:glycerophosphodiester phosphodiesterase [Leifsonia lichenia]